MRWPRRFYKRTVVVTALALLVVIIAGSLLVRFSGTLSGTENLVQFSIREEETKTAILGAGVTLSEPESGNLLQDTSFEPFVYRQSLTVYSGDATTLTVSSEDASQAFYGDGFFNDASARVMTRTENGYQLKKSARVLHYGINRIGVFQPVLLPDDQPAGHAFLDFSRSEDLSFGVGENGLMIQNIAGQVTKRIDSGLSDDLTGVCVYEGGIAVCSDAGHILYSTDGQAWNITTTSDRIPLRAIAVSRQGITVAVGDRGKIATGYNQTTTGLRPATQADLNDIVYGDDRFVVAGDQGVLLTSGNGVIWKPVPLTSTDNWKAIDYRDGRYIILGENGTVLSSDDGEHFEVLSQLDMTGWDILMLSYQQMIILDDAGAFYVSNDSGKSWQKSMIDTGMHSRIIERAGKDKIFSADDAGQIGLAQLVAEIQLDHPLNGDQYRAGDIIFLERTMLTVPESGLPVQFGRVASQSPWELFGTGEGHRTTETAAPQGGLSSMCMQVGKRDQPLILSQRLSQEALAEIEHNEILHVSLWMKQQDVTDRKVQVWLSGPFESAGTTFSNVGTGWKKYTYAFIVPVRQGGYTDQEIRLNVSVDRGVLWVDRVFLGRLDESPDMLSSELRQKMTTIKPQLIRLDFMGIGSQTVLPENWAQAMNTDNPTIKEGRWQSQRGVSLHAALVMARDCGADPWLVVDSFADEGELLHLIEYLSAPISEPYGKRRQEQGMVFPWTQEFQRITIEFCDRNQIFESDRQRADFVNRMIQTVSQSPYFREIKSQIIFVDGMTYHDGIMLSQADYHASDLQGSLLHNRLLTSESMISDYLDNIPRNTDKPVHEYPEMIRKAELQDTSIPSLRLSDLVDVALFDLGDQSGLVNLAWPVSGHSRSISVYSTAAQIVSEVAQGHALRVYTIETTNDGIVPDEQEPQAPVRAYAFFDEQTFSVVLTNLSSSTATCQLLAERNLAEAQLVKYDETGQLLSRQILRTSTSHITLLPGGVVVLTKEFASEEP